MASSVMVPARRLARNSSVTAITSNVPSRRAPVRLPSANSMKSACLNSRVSSRMPAGNSTWSRSSTLSSCRVSASVLVWGWR